MHVCDTSGSGAMAIFSLSSSGSGGSVSRTSSSRGGDNQRINATWDLGEKIKIFHAPAASSGSGNYTYKVKLLPGF